MALADREVYPTQPNPLRQSVRDLIDGAHPEPIEGEIVALIVPDSNRVQGGAVAAEAYKLIEGRSYSTVLLVAPSHEGPFERMTICRTNRYHTPLGEVAVNDRLRNELCDEDDDIFLDDRGHYHAEGAHVQLPFLQHALKEEFDIVPIVMGSESPAFCRELGRAVGEVMYGHRALLVASCDLLSGEAEALERLSETIEEYNVSELLHMLGSEQIRVEGMGALIVAVLAAQHRGANRARVLRVEAPEGGDIGALGCVFWRE